MLTVNSREEFLKGVKNLLPAYPKCVEIGVHRGDFSQMILDWLWPINLLLVDPFQIGYERYDDGNNVRYSTETDYYYVKNRFEQLMFVVVYRYDSTMARLNYQKGYFDFIYIDADHRYESVKQDLQMWSELLSENSLLCGHDYGNEVFTGVKKAVDEFLIENNFEMIILNQNGGDFALRRK